MNAGQIVDELGRIKAEIAELQEQEAKLREKLILSGVKKADGKLFHASISHSDVKSTAWKAVAEYLKASRQLIQAHTTVSTRTTVRVTARSAAVVQLKGEAA